MMRSKTGKSGKNLKKTTSGKMHAPNRKATSVTKSHGPKKTTSLVHSKRKSKAQALKK